MGPVHNTSSSLPQAHTMKRTRRKKSKAGRVPSDITAEEIASWFHLPSEEACVKLGVSLTVLKRICRKHGIERWPFRKLKSMGSKLPTASGATGSTQHGPKPSSSAWGTASMATASHTSPGLEAAAAAPSGAGASSLTGAFMPVQLQAQQADCSVRLSEVQSVAMPLALRPSTGTSSPDLAPAAATLSSNINHQVPSGLRRVPSETISGIDILLSAIDQEQQQDDIGRAGSRDSGSSQHSPADALAETADATLATMGTQHPGLAAALAACQAHTASRRLEIKQRFLAQWALVQRQQQQQQEQAAAAAAAAEPPSPSYSSLPQQTIVQHPQQGQEHALPPAESAPSSPRPEGGSGLCCKAEELSLKPTWMAEGAAAVPGAPGAGHKHEGGDESGLGADMDRQPTFRGWDGLVQSDKPPAQPSTSDFSFGGKAEGHASPPPVPQPKQEAEASALPAGPAPPAAASWPGFEATPGMQPVAPQDGLTLQQQQQAAPQALPQAHSNKRSAAELGGVMQQLLEGLAQPDKRQRLDSAAAAAALSPEGAAVRALLQQATALLGGSAPAAPAAGSGDSRHASVEMSHNWNAQALAAQNPFVALQQQQRLLQQLEQAQRAQEQEEAMRRLQQQLAVQRQLADLARAHGLQCQPEQLQQLAPLALSLLNQPEPAGAVQARMARQGSDDSGGAPAAGAGAGAGQQTLPTQLAERALRYYAQRLGFDITALQMQRYSSGQLWQQAQQQAAHQ